MSTIDVLTAQGDKAGTVELDEAIFGVQPNVPVMHQVVTAQLAARRAGGQHTKTRAEVRGGGAKPWRQKGTGRARHGSIRSPQWRGGGIALGPKHRDYRQRTPKKMVRIALYSALSDRASDGKVVVVDEWRLDQPSTKQAKAVLADVGTSGHVLVVVEDADLTAALSFRNLPEVHVCPASELNAYDVLVADYVVFTRATLPKGSGAEADTTEATDETPVDVTASSTDPAESPAEEEAS